MAEFNAQINQFGKNGVQGSAGLANEKGSGLNVNAQHAPRYGTDLSVSGQANIWNNGSSSLDAVGSYDRHYRGPSGTLKPNHSVGIRFTHKFD